MNRFKYLFAILLALSLTGCNEEIPQQEIDLLEENGLLHEKKPSMETTHLIFSPDSKFFTVTTRMVKDIGPWQLADNSSVWIDVKESINGIPKHHMLSVLTAARNIEAKKIADSGIKVQVLVDLTLPQEAIDLQQQYVADMLTCFNPDNLYTSFIYGDSITAPVKATEYVMSQYFTRQIASHKYLYRAVLKAKEEMEAGLEPWGDAKGKLLVVFSDGNVYLDDDRPMDPEHFDLQEKLLKNNIGTANNVMSFYISMKQAGNKQEDDHAEGILKIFCQNNGGQFLPAFDWMTIKYSVFNTYHIDTNSYEFDFVNPDFKIYRGNRHMLTLEFHSTKNDSLLASTTVQIRKGSIYKPVIVHGHDIWYVLLQGLLVGLLLILLVYLIFQYLVPFIRYRIFLKKYVITYTGPLMSAHNKVINQSCYLCKAPFMEGDRLVVKCCHTMHKSCWDENDYHCPEHGTRCINGSHYYDKSHPSKLRNASYYMLWIIAAMAASTIAWLLFMLWTHFFSSHILESILRGLNLISGKETQNYVNEISEHEKLLPAFGLTISFFLTWAFTLLAMYHRSVQRKWLSVFTRATAVGIGSMISFIIFGAIEAIFDIDPFIFLIEWIPWTFTAFLIAYASTYKTKIHLKKRMLLFAAIIAVFSMFGWSFLVIGTRLDFRVLLLFSYLTFGIGLAICVAEPISKSFHYFLRIEGPVKTTEIALYKWFEAAPHQSVTIGKSVNCNIQMSWDLMGNIAPIQAEIKTNGLAIQLHAIEEGVLVHDNPLPVDKNVRLYHHSQFRIGQTTFTYIEKDLC